jgi:hypothetical protein
VYIFVEILSDLIKITTVYDIMIIINYEICCKSIAIPFKPNDGFGERSRNKLCVLKAIIPMNIYHYRALLTPRNQRPIQIFEAL